MPWHPIELNDGQHPLNLCLVVIIATDSLLCVLSIGTTIPSIAFGTWRLGNGQTTTDRVSQAVSAGFNHIGVFAFLLRVAVFFALTC